jgi:hypothetical protein
LGSSFQEREPPQPIPHGLPFLRLHRAANSIANNGIGNPAAAKIRSFQNPPDPPLGFTELFATVQEYRNRRIGVSLLVDRSGSHAQRFASISFIR